MSEYRGALGLVKEGDTSGDMGGDLVYLVTELGAFCEGCALSEGVLDAFRDHTCWPLEIEPEFKYNLELPKEFLK